MSLPPGDDRTAGDIRSFFESNPGLPVLRRAFVEAVGTALLAVAMVGSGLAASRHAAAEALMAAVIVAISIAGALVGLIVALGKVSGGHFNPLITIAQWINGERGSLCTVSYIGAQTAGGVAGALVSASMFGSSLNFQLGGFPSSAMFLSEVIASAGLLTVVLGCARSTRWETGPFAVGAWLVAAILSTPSTSFANPAVTVAAILAPGLVGLPATTAAAFVLAQLMGLFLAVVVNKLAFMPDSADGPQPTGREAVRDLERA
jgi:glycerol uptake facilitator-like aquaporin